MIEITAPGDAVLDELAYAATAHHNYWVNRADSESEDEKARATCITLAIRWDRLRQQLEAIAASLRSGELVEPCMIIPETLNQATFCEASPELQSQPQLLTADDNGSERFTPIQRKPESANFAAGTPSSSESSPTTASADSSTRSEPFAPLNVADVDTL